MTEGLPKWPDAADYTFTHTWVDASGAMNADAPYLDHALYERAMKEAYAARLRLAVGAQLVASRRLADIADDMACAEPESACLRCRLYEVREGIRAALSAIGELP